MIDNEGNARITDFNLSQILDSTSPSIMNNGEESPRYLAPELVQRDVPMRTVYSDVWALGMTILEVKDLYACKCAGG